MHAALIVAAFTNIGCERQSASNGKPADSSQVRIISLSPAISRTLVDFKLEDQIVGRTPHCKSIDQRIPVVGDLLNTDYEAIIRLKPTHVLVQPPSAGIDEHLVELAKQHNWTLGQWRLNGRDDIEQMVMELPQVICGDDRACEATHSRRAAGLINEIAEALSPGKEPLFRGRVLVVHSVEPSVLISGAGTYHDDIVRMLGATNAATAKGWANLTLEDVARINPDAIIVVKPDAPQEVRVSDAAASLTTLPIEAARQNRIALARSPDGELPSAGLINVAREFREILRGFAREHAAASGAPS